MKKLNIFALGFTYAGCYLGAGYVSGQELWQFFGSYGIMGFAGLLLTIVLQFLFGIILIRIVKQTNIFEFDKIVVKGNNRYLRNIVTFVTYFFMFGIFIIMSAGAGALLERTFNIPLFLGCGLFCIIVSFVAFKGYNGLVSAFSGVVSVLVCGTVIVGIISLCKYGLPEVVSESVIKNSLLGNWFFSSLTYFSYNFLGSICIIVPLCNRIEEKDVIKGIGFGSVVLLVIALSIIIPIFSVDFVVYGELPMLELAYIINPVTGFVYAMLLLCGMFVASLGSIVSITEYFNNKYNFEIKKWFNPVLCGVAWMCSFAGFSKLIGTVYPLSGYFGFLVIVGIIYHYITLKKRM